MSLKRGRNSKWLDPTVNILHTFSENVSARYAFESGHDLVRNLHSHVITFIGHRRFLSDFRSFFRCISIALYRSTTDSYTATAFRTDHRDALFEMFELMGGFFPASTPASISTTCGTS